MEGSERTKRSDIRWRDLVIVILVLGVRRARDEYAWT